jgi:hypothetical protein
MFNFFPIFSYLTPSPLPHSASVLQRYRESKIGWAPCTLHKILHYLALSCIDRMVCIVLHFPTLSFILCCPTLSFNVLHCPPLSSIVLHCPALSVCIFLQCSALSLTVQHSPADRTVLWCSLLTFTVLHSPALSCNCPAS